MKQPCSRRGHSLHFLQFTDTILYAMSLRNTFSLPAGSSLASVKPVIGVQLKRESRLRMSGTSATIEGCNATLR